MVGPERKRQAVLHVRQELKVSERRACTTIRQPRATQRYRGRKPGKDTALAQWVADLPVPGSLHVVFRGMPQFPGIRKICRKRLKAPLG